MSYRPGDFYRIDDRTGFKVRSSETVKQWDGLIVHRDQYEQRHPQDFVRGRRDRQTVPDPRPESTDRFVGISGGPWFLVEQANWRFEGGYFRVFGAASDTVTEADF